MEENKMNMSEECFVCMEDYNHRTHRKVTCPFCDFAACFQCWKRVLLQSVNEAKCMSCEKRFNRTIISQMFGSSFLANEYKKHREEIIFQVQQSKFGETQDLARDLKQRCENDEFYERNKKLIDGFVMKATNLRHIIVTIEANSDENNPQPCTVSGEYEGMYLPELKKIESDLYHKMNQLKSLPEMRWGNRSYYFWSQINNGLLPYSCEEMNRDRSQRRSRESRRMEKNKTCTKPAFFGLCPQPECPGMIKSNWKCGLCENKVCKKCREPLPIFSNEREKGFDDDDGGDGGITPGHVCDPNIVKSIQVLKQKTKPCPKCKALIAKIEGCNLMWCTQCHTSFSWETGEVAVNMGHNPHYVEWLRTRKTSNTRNEDHDDLMEDNVIECIEPRNITRYDLTRRVNIVPMKLETKTNFLLQDRMGFAPELDMVFHRAVQETFLQNFTEFVSHVYFIHVENHRPTYMFNGTPDPYLRARLEYLAGQYNEPIKIGLRMIKGEELFKIKLQRIEKAEEKKQEKHDILDMFVRSSCDVIGQLLQRINERDISYPMESEHIIKPIIDLIDFTNQTFMNVMQKHNNMIPKIVFGSRDDFRFGVRLFRLANVHPQSPNRITSFWS